MRKLFIILTFMLVFLWAMIGDTFPPQGPTTSTPKLTVGQVKITGGSPGAGKVLTSDDSGLASWQTIPTGGASSAGINVETLTADKTLDPATDKMYQYLDPGAVVRVITLSTASAVSGDRFVIRHNGNVSNTNYLHIKQGDTSLDVIYSGSIREYIFEGTDWVAAGIGAGEVDDKKYNMSLGYGAQGYDHGLAIGDYTQGYTYGAALGYYASGYNYGIGIGRFSYGYTYGAALAYAAKGYNYGTAVGSWACGYDYGVAAGFAAQGLRRGVAIGYYAGYGLDTLADRYNILIGYQAGRGIDTGLNNIIIGRQDATTGRITTGSNNILIGYEVGAGIDPAGSNQLNIGNLIFGTGISSGATLSTGNVGIGTTTPQQKLELNGGVRLNTTDAKPTCSETTRGTFWVTQGGAGVKDSVEVCAKDATDVYAWRTLY